MENNATDAPLEVMPPSAIMAIEKANVDIQIATAHQYPRTMDLFRKRAISMATMDEETAESCVYCRPVGKEKNKVTGVWEEKYAEGASIRMAEIVAASYGNIRVSAMVVEQTPRFVRCAGIAHDLESNYAGKSECIESTVTREGQPYSERQRALVAKVCLAKAYRDAVFKVVPKALAKPILKAAEALATQADKPIEQRREKAKAWISKLKIDENRVLAALNVKSWDQVSGDHLVKLTGLKTAIGDGDENIDTVFPPIGAGQTNSPKQTGTQQATGQTPPAAQTAPQTPPAAASGSAQAPATPPQTPPEGQKPQEPAKAAEPTRRKRTVASTGPAPAGTQTAQTQPGDGESFETAGPTEPKEDAKELAEAGLAPTAAAATAAQQAAQPPQENVQVAAPDPYFLPVQSDSDAIASIRTLARQSGVTWNQLKKYLKDGHVMRDEQNHLSELATGKLEKLGQFWHTKLADILKLPR